MAELRVFISSTCYDLAVVREQLRGFLSSLGYQPIMSDYSDVLYDPRVHTHTSCLLEVTNTDVLIVIVGSRFGGTGVPEAMKHVDFENLRTTSSSQWVIDHAERLSVTQLEVLRAIEENIPIFAFVEDQVWHDHLVYERNKDILKDIVFHRSKRRNLQVTSSNLLTFCVCAFEVIRFSVLCVSKILPCTCVSSGPVSFSVFSTSSGISNRLPERWHN